MATREKAFAAGTWQSTTASSAALDVSDLEDVVVMLAGTFAGTLKVDVSFDGTNFAEWGSKTAPAAYATIPACKAIKMRCSAYTSGTPRAGVVGLVKK